MALRFDAFFLAVFYAQIGRGTAVHLRRILGVARFPFFGFHTVPVKRHGGEIEKLGEFFTVSGVFFLRFKLVQQKQVGAEAEFVVDLLNFHGHVFGKRTVGKKDNMGVSFAVVFDTAFHTQVGKFSLFVKMTHGNVTA